MKIQNFYKNKIISNAKNNLFYYTEKFTNQKVIIFFEHNTYYNAPKNQGNFSKDLISSSVVTLAYIF